MSTRAYARPRREPRKRPDPVQAETTAYRRDGYVALPALFPVEVLHAFYATMQRDLAGGGRSMRAFAAKGPLLRREAIEINAHQYAPMKTLLWGLTPRIAVATACDLLPTYAYFRLYQRGDVCRVHTDRQACEHSVSLTIAYSDDQPWALSVGTERIHSPVFDVTDDFGGRPHGSVAMSAGDAVLYQGTHHRHGRVEPNPNGWSAHLFLHWVDRHGDYAEQAFDRPTLERVAAVGGASAG